MNYCPKCKTDKDNSEFGTDNRRNNGLTCQCRDCRQVNYKRYSRSKIGLITRIYRDQRHRGSEKGLGLPSYKKEELISWILNNDKFELLYVNWVDSGYNRMLSPSCDRINSLLPYSLGNLELMSWKQNLDNCARDKKKGLFKNLNRNQ